MTKKDSLLARILGGRSDAAIRFEELRGILRDLGFQERIRGSHHLFVRAGLEELINLQKEGKSGEAVLSTAGAIGNSSPPPRRCSLMHRYETIIYWSDEDKAFIAEVPELPGCIAHGDSPEGALANCHDAIELWLDTAREFGRQVPEPKGRRLRFA